MSKNCKKSDYYSFCLSLLRYKTHITLANIGCNVTIFSHMAAITYFVRQILNALQKTPQGGMVAYALPYLGAIIGVVLLRVAAILGCASLDALRSYNYQMRTRANFMCCIMNRDDITTVAGNSGELFELIDDDIPACTYPPELLTEVTGFTVYTLIALTMLLSIDAKLTLLVFIPLSLAILIVRQLADKLKDRRRVNREAHDDVSSFIMDISDSSLAIKTAGAEHAVLGRYRDVNRKRADAILSDTYFNERVSFLLNGAVTIGSAVMMFIAAKHIVSGEFGIGDFSIFIAHLGTLSNLATRIIELIGEYKKAEVSFERIAAQLTGDIVAQLSYDTDIRIKGVQIQDAKPSEAQPLSSLEIRELEYRYADGGGCGPVSFSALPGELVVVRGGMASGKSTLTALLMGLIKPQHGHIEINGKSVNNIRDLAFGSILGIPGRSCIFAESIDDNIRLGTAIPREKLNDAIKAAALDTDIMGDDGQPGNRGDSISGGQRQRLALARAFARDSSIYVIDDCMSALDAATRSFIVKGLKARIKAKGRIAIIATNEPDVIDLADRLVTLGKV